LHCEGFCYIGHKKGLYFNGHDHPDVVAYRQDVFLPVMKAYGRWLVHYVINDVDMQVPLDLHPGECPLVLVAHDEMTAQANDARAKLWVLEDQHALQKKGVGWGIHKSDVICSTVGWLEDASQTLEYGKNYEGYWTGKLFVKQVRVRLHIICCKKCNTQLQLTEKIIPAFEKPHGPSYQALIMVDNSQGHSAYATNALVVSRMNVNPSGKQALMHDTWFMQNGEKVAQTMVYPSNHPTYLNKAKGIKAVLTERGLCPASRTWGKCESKCDPDATSCCLKHILERQPNFQLQKSLVQEVIEAAGHLCIFLSKFHCKLNFIEFFWGLVKKYLCDNCDYTFDTLKENMPKALALVKLVMIHHWEHWMQWWMEAYPSGLATTGAQRKVKEFSSAKYTSYRHIPEAVACAMDWLLNIVYSHAKSPP
jgi:hypothetical protein